MPTTLSTIQQAAAAILAADATLQGLCGRPDDLVREPHTLSEAPLPILILLAEGLELPTGRVPLVLAAAAQDTPSAPASEICLALLERAVEALDYQALAAEGVDVIPLDPSYRTIDGDDAMFGFVSVAAQPSLRLMQVVIPMLAFTD